MLYKNRYLIKESNLQKNYEILDTIENNDDEINVSFNVPYYTQTILLTFEDIQNIHNITTNSTKLIESNILYYGASETEYERCQI